MVHAEAEWEVGAYADLKWLSETEEQIVLRWLID